jgi:hypothetical protein
MLNVQTAQKWPFRSAISNNNDPRIANSIGLIKKPNCIWLIKKSLLDFPWLVTFLIPFNLANQSMIWTYNMNYMRYRFVG